MRIATAHLHTVVDSLARIGNSQIAFLFWTTYHNTNTNAAAAQPSTFHTHPSPSIHPSIPHPGSNLDISDISQPDSPTTIRGTRNREPLPNHPIPLVVTDQGSIKHVFVIRHPPAPAAPRDHRAPLVRHSAGDPMRWRVWGGKGPFGEANATTPQGAAGAEGKGMGRGCDGDRVVIFLGLREGRENFCGRWR